ncbi:hypothetical protein AAVH_31968 [Aphelenchoides avenae]|nr:hypothetical protein AAVH_31968 [Aphelenchus avenae]
MPTEVIEQAFRYLSRDDIEAVQICCRYFHSIISTEGFGKVTPLRLLGMVQLLNDEIAIWRNGEAKRFDYALIDSEDVLRWLRNTCVKSMCLVNTTYLMPAQLRTEPEQAERALRWFVAHRSMLRVVGIHVKLPLANDELKQAFLRPDPSHQWTLASLSGDIESSYHSRRLHWKMPSISLSETRKSSVAFKSPLTTWFAGCTDRLRHSSNAGNFTLLLRISTASTSDY